MKNNEKIAVVILNWNGSEDTLRCLESLEAQRLKPKIYLVDNASTDGLLDKIRQSFPRIIVIKNTKNLGFAGGVNAGLRKAIKDGIEWVALLNNDAIADKDWLKKLSEQAKDGVGIITGKTLKTDGTIDSAGLGYSKWGLTYPIGRGESGSLYNNVTQVFGASGGASLYRVEMLKIIGLFDEDFFAYYEDADISFRAQLADWKVVYTPEAIATHKIGTAASKVKNIHTYQSIKNLPWLFWKNIPLGLLIKIAPRFFAAYSVIILKALLRGKIWAVFKGIAVSLLNLPKKLVWRTKIQKQKRVKNDSLWPLISTSLPTSNKTKTVLVDARESGTSSGRYVDKLLEYLHKENLDFKVVLLAKKHRLDYLKNLVPNFDVVETKYKEFTFGEQFGLLFQIKRLKPDLVFFPMVQQPIFYRGPVVTMMQDLTTTRFNNPTKNRLIFSVKQHIYKHVNRVVAKKSRAILTFTEFVKNEVAIFCKVTPNKITVTPLAADKITVPATAIKNLYSERFICYVGRPQTHKNLNRLVEAFTMLSKTEPDLYLVFAGKKDDLYQKLEELVVSKGLSERVIFTDFLSEGELRWLYENAAAYVFPSLSEGFGLPSLEAMVHSCPVVSSNASCLPEVNGEAAIYFNPEDVNDMAQKISSVINNDKLQQELIKKGHSQALRYSWQTTARKTLEVFYDVLGGE
jgi:GT2 family glycosyltransferase/glycosyltransferase involved in cell wall biosynthesis